MSKITIIWLKQSLNVKSRGSMFPRAQPELVSHMMNDNRFRSPALKLDVSLFVYRLILKKKCVLNCIMQGFVYLVDDFN